MTSTFFNLIIRFLYIIFWISGLFVFFCLIILITNFEDYLTCISQFIKSKDYLSYIPPLAILISAFLASISVQLSILNTKRMEKNKKEDAIERVYLEIQYIYLSLKYEIKLYKSICDTANSLYIKRTYQNIEGFDLKKQLDAHSDVLLNRLKVLEEINLSLLEYNFLNHITKTCIALTRLNTLNSVLINLEKPTEKSWTIFYSRIQESITFIDEQEEKVISLLKNKLKNEQILDIDDI